MSPGITGGVAAAILVPLIFRLLSQARGLRIEVPPDFDYAGLTKKYSKWEGIGFLIFLPFLALSVFLLYRTRYFIWLVICIEHHIRQGTALAGEYIFCFGTRLQIRKV